MEDRLESSKRKAELEKQVGVLQSRLESQCTGEAEDMAVLQEALNKAKSNLSKARLESEEDRLALSKSQAEHEFLLNDLQSRLQSIARESSSIRASNY
jgi:hypothetical protein